MCVCVCVCVCVQEGQMVELVGAGDTAQGDLEDISWEAMGRGWGNRYTR